MLRGYRRKKVSLQKMRPFIQEMRAAWGIPYPLAHFKPLILDRKLVYELQQKTLLDPALYLFQFDADQMLLAPPLPRPRGVPPRRWLCESVVSARPQDGRGDRS